MPWAEEVTQGNLWRKLAPVLIIVVNNLTWNTFVLSSFINSVNNLSVPYTEALGLFAAEYSAIAFSAVFGSMYFRHSRRVSLFVWMLFGALATYLAGTVPNDSMLVSLLVAFFLGASVGFGLPSSLSYFADNTKVENRGFFGGVTFFFVGLSTMVLVGVMTLFAGVAVMTVMVFWRLGGALLFVLTYCDKVMGKEMDPRSYSSPFFKRDLILYLVPWTTFCLINSMEAPLLSSLFGDLFDIMSFIEVVLAGVFALVGGLVADFAGRKRVTITGFVILGVDFAMLSLLPSTSAWYIHTTLDSIAWGMFASVFFMTVWGDLAGNRRKEKYYLAGGLPYLFAVFFSEIIRPFVSMMPLTTAFSLASFLLFSAVIPLMYAPETLPELRIKQRELKDYISRAKHIKEKHT